jgi:carboxyl-terminal processing protease
LLDLRDDPGGLRDEAIAAASQFIGDGVVLVERDRAGRRQEFQARPGGAALDLPVVVLVNEDTASSAEILAGALRDRGRARLVGTTTVGAGTVLSTYSLSDGSALLLGTHEWLTPSGRQIWRRGIEPDVHVDLAPGVYPLSPEQTAQLEPDALARSPDQPFRRALEELTGR